MIDDHPVPRLREDLEIIPTTYRGRRAIVVRDSLGLIREPVLVEGDALSLLGLLDGRRTVRDIQLEFIRLKQGVLVDRESISRMIADFDAARLLQSKNFLAEKDRLIKEYAGLKVRQPFHAGISYPASAGELRTCLEAILGEARKTRLAPGHGRVLGLIAPHIDLDVGRPAYAAAYGAIRGLRPRRVFLIGTGHHHSDGVLSLSEKDFETPLGLVETDRAAVRALRRAGGTMIASSDIIHRREHSLEFQLVFLQHVLGSPFRLVPILCGSLSAELERVSRPREIPQIETFVAVLRALFEEDGEDGLVVAGVDFSHIGPKFGHRDRAAALIPLARDHDRRLIDAIVAGDAAAFWGEARRVGDRYNVCGLSALAILLELFPEASGELLAYHVWNEEATQSAVSFAAILLKDGGNRGGRK